MAPRSLTITTRVYLDVILRLLDDKTNTRGEEFIRSLEHKYIVQVDELKNEDFVLDDFYLKRYDEIKKHLVYFNIS